MKIQSMTMSTVVTQRIQVNTLEVKKKRKRSKSYDMI